MLLHALSSVLWDLIMIQLASALSMPSASLAIAVEIYASHNAVRCKT